MGDRANFGFRQGTDIVYLYGHWAGYHMMAKLANALQHVVAVGRANDSTYATRIAISQLIGDDWTSDLGWGISINTITDNEHTIPVVDFDQGIVTLHDYDWEIRELENWPKASFTIERFIKRFGE